MGIHVAIHHKTSYLYERRVKMWPQVIRLRPAPHSRTKILGYSLKIEPENHFINWMQDPFGNYQARIVFPEKVKKFSVDVEVIADLVAVNPFDFFLEEDSEKFPFEYDEQLKKELLPYLEITESDRQLMDLLESCQQYKDQQTVDFLVSVNQHIYDLLKYTIRMEPGVQSAEVTLKKKLGSCRDFAWLFCQLLRHMGLATRFVSGYLVQLEADEKAVDGPAGPKEDFTDLHAWTEVFIPGAGWIGLDATSGLFAGEGHIPLACTPHPTSAAPITGGTEPAKVEFSFKNTVERIYEAPRVSKPFTKEEVQNIIHLGYQVDALLKEQDVRLTMGGEPTFVSTEDMESAQWNHDADGIEKRQLAYQLAIELRKQFGPAGLIHCGQGKWYPGEPMPRWQYSLYWRKDGEPIWHSEKLLANPNQSGQTSQDDVQPFINHLASLLGIPVEYAIPAYEDEYYYLWEKRNLPIDFDPKKHREDARIEQKTLHKILEHGIENAVGYVLPLKWNHQYHAWESCVWEFEGRRLFLIPGNSQMGLRLPLDRLPLEADQVENMVIPVDPMLDETQIPTRTSLLNKISQRRKDDFEYKPIPRVKTFKTAICAYIENGNLHLFIPPIEEIQPFLDLVTSIEQCASDLNIPVVLEGYQPPFHKEVTKLVVAPDPGVIEVNVHPATDWAGLLEIYNTVFKAARINKLGTNKFMLDGRHMGSGGGNHITLGGTSPAESPILRRPDLLRSMLNFWQNHPSLSYLFSSTFIGPTSQAPRIDEGRPDIIYELEIAFSELDKLEKPPYWMVDRIFRNLLTDLTGNTHRAEFCIDKLYNPDSASGRLGILELRGFEMPPHEEMNLIQLLLIRSLVAVFWKSPYRNKLINWGTDLHNRFMMHHFIKEDIYEVVDYLNHQGIAFNKNWLDVFLDFRFPIIGEVNIKGINLTLRAGIEPWIVLGEEMSSSGTARYVDSSIERLEVMVEDFNDERYHLLCNSCAVPLVKTAYQSKYIAAIRYKAWAPHSALHPTIGVNTPLVFDIYDTWNNRSIGGCTYHVMHPGGRNYETFPVNTLEAESRRITRFWEFNHSPKTQSIITNQEVIFGEQNNYVTTHNEIKENISIKTIPVSQEFPHTLDLRRG